MTKTSKLSPRTVFVDRLLSKRRSSYEDKTTDLGFTSKKDRVETYTRRRSIVEKPVAVSRHASGFMSYIDCNSINSKNNNPNGKPSDRLIYQYRLLVNIFPNFPKEMMKTLLIREKGDSKYVCSYLQNLGWSSEKDTLVNYLITDANEFFSCKYFWGEKDDRYLEQLETLESGSFFTVILPNERKYILCFINFKREIIQKPVPSFLIMDDIIQVFSLKYPISRPSHINNTKLINFLV